jgi:hypothetical protein
LGSEGKKLPVVCRLDHYFVVRNAVGSDQEKRVPEMEDDRIFDQIAFVQLMKNAQTQPQVFQYVSPVLERIFDQKVPAGYLVILRPVIIDQHLILNLNFIIRDLRHPNVGGPKIDRPFFGKILLEPTVGAIGLHRIIIAPVIFGNNSI